MTVSNAHRLIFVFTAPRRKQDDVATEQPVVITGRDGFPSV
jgi:hypothetical protein